MTSKLKMLRELRLYFDEKAVKTIYSSLILPALSYCGILSLKLSPSQVSKINKFHDCTQKIVFKKMQVYLASPHLWWQIRNGLKKTLLGKLCNAFLNYFTTHQHEQNTRNNCFSIKLHSIKKEYACKRYYFMATKIYNDLTLDIRKTDHFKNFEKLLNKYYEH